MSEVKRYVSTRILPDASTWNSSGAAHTYVHAADYAALEAECERLRAQRDAILLQARCWAGEAKTHQSITREVGAILGGIPSWGPIAASVEAMRAELEAIKGQEPVAIANKGDCAFWVSWTDAGKPLRGPGIKLYALPPAKADEVSVRLEPPENAGTPDDPLYEQAVKWVRESGRASIAVVQRKLKIGYNRAARLVETMEAEGVVTYPDSHGRREVIRTS